MHPDTIFALASGRPPAAIGLIRVSGARAHDAARAIAGELASSRQAALRHFRDPFDGSLIDEGLLLLFDAGASATGEQVAEFHIHGSRAVADAMLRALGQLEGLREAQPGEFTRRAFENGRLDLTEAEGLADLLEAETEAQRRAALALADGGLRRQVEQWQDVLLGLSARAELLIDYDDDALDPALNRDCGALAKELGEWLERPLVEPLKDGVRVVVAGPPNAGKSSLVNAIAGSERAIVTATAGTTRDRIDVPLAIGGVPVVLTDTAGLRDTDEPTERIGVKLAESAIGTADILLWLGEPRDAPDHPRSMLVHARCDLPERADTPEHSMAASSRTGEGISELLSAVARLVQQVVPAPDALALNRRQADAIAGAEEALSHAAATADILIMAEQLRAARSSFDRLTGRAGVEDVLDALFGRFCLGK